MYLCLKSSFIFFKSSLALSNWNLEYNLIAKVYFITSIIRFIFHKRITTFVTVVSLLFSASGELEVIFWNFQIKTGFDILRQCHSNYYWGVFFHQYQSILITFDGGAFLPRSASHMHIYFYIHILLYFHMYCIILYFFILRIDIIYFTSANRNRGTNVGEKHTSPK